MSNKHKIHSWKDCRDEDNIKAACKPPNFVYEEAVGSHFQIKNLKTHESLTAYHSHDISTGVAVKIFKTLKRWGVVCLFLLVLYIKFCYTA